MRTTALLIGMMSLALGSLQVAAQVAETHSFLNLNQAIPDGKATGLSDVQTVSSGIANLASVRVKLHLAGEFNGDLYAYVRHVGSGVTNFCVLLNRVGRTAANSVGYADTGLDVTFDDAALNGDIHHYHDLTSPPLGTPLTGTWQPDGRRVDPDAVLDTTERTTTLGSFSGADASGQWTLFVADLESGGTNMLTGWELEVIAAPTVVGRRVFYNHSGWDGANAAANAGDDAAIAPDKTALMPGGVATFANYTSYSKGLNGIMVDIANLAGTPTVSDFAFRVGNNNTPAGWVTAPAPASLTSRDLGGGVTRLTLIWSNNNFDVTADLNEAVTNNWLEVTVLAGVNTGLAADDVFYIGNAVGECGGSASGTAPVNTTDVLLPFNNQTANGVASLTSAYDINRDRTVNTTDVLLPFNHQTGDGSALVLLDLSGSAGSVLVGATSPPAPMSLADLAALFAGEYPGPDWGAGGTSANRVGRLSLERVGVDQLRLRLAGVAGVWELQSSENPQQVPWEKLEATAQASPEGPTWLIEIGVSQARFFRATAVPTATPNP